ncbi:MAG TPA: hypothetical protein VLQ68_02790, partial [Rhizobiaceae bacterium]|nr:hypothetical protein [Rhizobiaceae bacterium]
VPDATGRQPFVLLMCGAAGLLLLILLKTRLRLIGILPIAAMVAFGRAEPTPDLIISQGGRAIGMADSRGRLALLYPGRESFITGIWEKAWPSESEADAGSMRQQCDKEQCVAVSPGGVRVEIIYKPELLDAACLSADILAAPRLRYVDCNGRKPGLILKRGDFEEKGTHLIRFNGGSGSKRFRVETAITPDSRPWNLARRPPPVVTKRNVEPKQLEPEISSGGSDPQGVPEPLPGPD